MFQVNRNISTTYGNIVQICNPFSAPPEYQYQPQDCPANTVQIGDIPQVCKTAKDSSLVPDAPATHHLCVETRPILLALHVETYYGSSGDPS